MTDSKSVAENKKSEWFLCGPLVVFFLASFCGIANAKSPTLLLGVPFGEKVFIKKCPDAAAKRVDPCWISDYHQNKSTGWRLGYVYLPREELRPKWAAHGLFSIHQDKDGKIASIALSGVSQYYKRDAINSISLRFGPPVRDQSVSLDSAYAIWRSPEGYAEMICGSDCRFEFRTAAYQAEIDDAAFKRSQTDAKRPTAP